MLTTDLLAFVRAALPAPPAHVLEIGAGDGKLAAVLKAAGYQVTAIDPVAEDGSHVKRRTLLEVDGHFDAALSVVALHHVQPFEASCAHLASLLAPAGRLVIDEIDAACVDERAAAWWLGQRRALGGEEDEDPLSLVAGLREHVTRAEHHLRRPEAVLRAGGASARSLPAPLGPRAGTP